MSEKEYNSLIEGLAQDLKPVRPMAHPVVRVLPWVGLTAAYILAVGFVCGYREDLFLKFKDPVFLLETGLALFTALSAVLASAWMCVPDLRGRQWIGLPALIGFGLFMLWTIGRFIMEPHDYSHLLDGHCLVPGILMALVPGAILVFMMKKGATCCPCKMGLMNILAVGAAGYIGVRMTCHLDSALDGTLYHIIPYVIGGTILGKLARKCYKW